MPCSILILENNHPLSLVDLNKELDKAIQIEDYDRAAMLRDEIKKRS